MALIGKGQVKINVHPAAVMDTVISSSGHHSGVGSIGLGHFRDGHTAPDPLEGQVLVSFCPILWGHLD